MKLRSFGAAAVVAALTIGPLGFGGVASAASPGWRFKTVISGLNAPRGLAFDGRGGLYVAQAGKLATTPPPAVSMTGSVSKYTWSQMGLKKAWSTPFTSVSVDFGGPTPDVLGPAGVSATGNSCKRDDDHGGRCKVVALLSLSHDGVKAGSGVDVPQIGHLFQLNSRTGAAKDLSNVGDQNFKWTSDHKDLFTDFPDSNPYGALVTSSEHRGTRTFVSDAGANTINEVLRDGTARVISYIPNETFGAHRDATPTCIAEGPDGYLYVGALDLVSNLISPAHSGQSNVWRVNPNSTDWEHYATLWASGYTTINGCTFDRHGNFWASELLYPNAAGAPGDLAMASFRHPSMITHIGSGMVPLPAGIDQGPDGAMYVSTGSSSPAPNGGAVVRVAKPHTDDDGDDD